MFYRRLSIAIASACLGIAIIAMPLRAPAATVTGQLTVALTTSTSFATTGQSGFFGLSSPITVAAGDTLNFDLFFSGSQAVQVSDGGATEAIFLFFGTTAPNIGLETFTLSLTGAAGDALLTTFTGTSLNSSSILVASLTGNLTNSSFTFTDVHASITPSTSSFDVASVELFVQGPRSIVTGAVPEPGTLLLVSLIVPALGVHALRRRIALRKERRTSSRSNPISS